MMGKRPPLELDQSFTPALHPRLEEDIQRFKKEHKVPEGLASSVDSSEEFQARWYEELSSTWPEKQPSPEEAAKLVFATLEIVHHGYVFVSDLEGFLRYYGLSAYDPSPPRPSYVYGLVPPPPLFGEASSVEEDETMESSCDKSNSLLKTLPPWTFAEHGPRFTMETLPVDKAHVFQEEEATDLTVFVAVKEFGLLPSKMLRIISQYKAALAGRDGDQAQKLLDKLNEGEYQIVTTANGVRRLTKKYQIKLRGINVLDIEPETKENLKMMVDGKRLDISVYDFDDSYKGWVGDVYCDDIFLLDYCRDERAI